MDLWLISFYVALLLSGFQVGISYMYVYICIIQYVYMERNICMYGSFYAALYLVKSFALPSMDLNCHASVHSQKLASNSAKPVIFSTWDILIPCPSIIRGLVSMVINLCTHRPSYGI